MAARLSPSTVLGEVTQLTDSRLSEIRLHWVFRLPFLRPKLLLPAVIDCDKGYIVPLIPLPITFRTLPLVTHSQLFHMRKQ